MESNEFDVRRTVISVLEQCAKCKHHYSLDDTRVVERQGELWVLSVRCSHCDTQAYVAAVVDSESMDVDQIGTMESTDVETEDVLDEADVDEPVSVDDVLDLHLFLESFDGDFARLFSRRKR